MPFQVRPLTPADAVAFDAFLTPHTAEAYYLRSNAMAAGLVYEGKPVQAEYFGAMGSNGLVGAIGYSWLDTILIFTKDEACLSSLAQALLPSIERRGGRIDAILGLRKQADAVLRALAIPPQAIREHGEDGLFRLDLKEMNVPPLSCGTTLREAQEKDRALLISWRIAFNIEAVHAQPGAALEDKVRKEIHERLAIRKDLYLLEKDGRPVSFCGIGGSIPDCVMVGPVWTPPELRGHGYAKRVTAWGLIEAAKKTPSITRAVLFASRPDAVRVYKSIGFKRIADWRLALMKENFRLPKIA